MANYVLKSFPGPAITIDTDDENGDGDQYENEDEDKNDDDGNGDVDDDEDENTDENEYDFFCGRRVANYCFICECGGTQAECAWRPSPLVRRSMVQAPLISIIESEKSH